ncbi:hypothetical protein P7K49_018313 [Saguinus oedipus]|uniref:Uncharacterized protein n=1 Tax=Saguinus oedipus TaxID=9490 RepID=A0ABQ9V5H9_SAGOE|nr:hypothetical protein P7K49_018313 [Saguinus oedipus]
MACGSGDCHLLPELKPEKKGQPPPEKAQREALSFWESQIIRPQRRRGGRIETVLLAPTSLLATCRCPHSSKLSALDNFSTWHLTQSSKMLHGSCHRLSHALPTPPTPSHETDTLSCPLQKVDSSEFQRVQGKVEKADRVPQTQDLVFLPTEWS